MSWIQFMKISIIIIFLNSIFRTLWAKGLYTFADKTLNLEFWDPNELDYSPVSIFVTSLHNQKKFQQTEAYVFSKTILGKNSKTFSFKIPITDICILNKSFTVDISYIFLADIDVQLFSSRYKFGVSRK